VLLAVVLLVVHDFDRLEVEHVVQVPQQFVGCGVRIHDQQYLAFGAGLVGGRLEPLFARAVVFNVPQKQVEYVFPLLVVRRKKLRYQRTQESLVYFFGPAHKQHVVFETHFYCQHEFFWYFFAFHIALLEVEVVDEFIHIFELN